MGMVNPLLRLDLYYFEKNKNQHLRSKEDVEKYCKLNSINFVPDVFSFKGSDHFSREVVPDSESEESDINYCHYHA